MVLIRKTYENYEDFDNALREAKPTEIFYNFSQHPNKGNPANMLAVVSLMALSEGEKSYTLMQFYDVSDIQIPTTKEASAQQSVAIKSVIDEFIKKLQKNHAGSFLKNGVLKVE